ncbi:MAG: SIS domain-containing protein [Pseudomonadales bacterium]
MNADILARIRLLAPALSRAEAQVAQCVLAEPRQAAESAIAQLAAAAGVSEPTIVRFCRSLGLSGFRELRTQLVVSLQHPDSFLHQDVDSADAVSDAAAKVLENSVRALVNLRAVANGMPFEQAVSLMQPARQLVFVGLGASGHVALDAEHKFFRLGIPTTSATDIQTIMQRAAIAQPGDVYIATSYSGTWRELVDAMSLVVENGAHVIAITDPSSPLARTAQIAFESHPSEDTSVYTPMSSRLVHLALLDALQVALALAMGADAEDKLRRSKQALSKFRSSAAGVKV